jgi:hypothetical protein
MALAAARQAAQLLWAYAQLGFQPHSLLLAWLARGLRAQVGPSAGQAPASEPRCPSATYLSYACRGRLRSSGSRDEATCHLA